MVWGLPRTTHDIDFVIEAKKEDKIKIINLFKKDFYISDEAVSQAIEGRSSFNIIHFKASIKVDFWLVKKDPYRKLEFKRRLKKKIFGKQIFIISPEDLILGKLLWFKECYSSKHLDDIESVLKISKLDFDYIEKWAKQHSTYKIFKKLQKT